MSDFNREDNKLVIDGKEMKLSRKVLEDIKKVYKEPKECQLSDFNLVVRKDYIVVRYHGYSILTLNQNGTFSRVARVSPNLGLDLNSERQINESDEY